MGKGKYVYLTRGARQYPAISRAATIRYPAMARKRRRTVPRVGTYRTGGFYGRYSGKTQELKFHDVDQNDAVISATGSVSTSWNLIAQGVTESQRVGRKCTLRSINWRGTLGMSSTTDFDNTSDVARIMLVLDKQANGAVPAVLDILETALFQSFNNLSNSARFVTLFDRRFDMNCQGGQGNGTTFESVERKKTFSMYKKCNIPIEFSSTTGAITEIRSNNLIMLTISESGLARLDSKVRLRFSDS